jgi:hypothetical protein
LSQAVFKGDGPIDLWLSEPSRRQKDQKASHNTDKHSADEETSGHSENRLRFADCRLVAGEAKEVAAVMNEFMNHPAMDEKSGALLGSDKVNGQ